MSTKQELTSSRLPPITYLTVVDNTGTTLFETRLSSQDYLAIVAANNFKQRARAVQLYFHADALNYAVLGTTNRDELLLGFFVKLGDGAADVETVDVLYKTEIYQLAKAMGVNDKIIDRAPTTDTLPGQRSSKEYFYGIDYPVLDQALSVIDGFRSEADAAKNSGVSQVEMGNLVHNLRRRKETTKIIGSHPLSPSRTSIERFGIIS
jgi:NAD+ synthase